MITLETIFRATVHYEGDESAIKAIEDAAFNFAGGLKVETMGGNAACAPYVVAEGTEAESVREWAELLTTAIKRHKKARIL